MKMRNYPRAALGAAALSGLLAAPLVAAGAGIAVAQGTVTTQGYIIGNGSVSGATASAQPDTAGATADYTVGFTTPSALTKGSSTVTLSAPNGQTTFPSSSTDYFVVDNSSPSGSQPVASTSLGTGGHSVVIGLSASLAAKSSLSVYIQGVTNPATPGPYSLDISTSANPSPASTATYQIVAASLPPAFNPASAPPLAGGLATYTIGAFKAAAALAAGTSITLTSAAGTGPTDNVAFPAAASAYKVTDLTTNSSSAPQAVSVAGLSAGRSGETVTLDLAAAVAAGDELSVSVSGARNPSSTQTDTVSAAAPATATPVSASLGIGTSVTNPTVSLSQSTAGVSGVEYTIGFTPFSALSAGATVTLVAPPGTSFSGSSVTVLDATHASASANVSPGSVRASVAGSSSTQNEITFSLPNAIAAGDSLVVDISGVANPPAGDYGGSAGNFSVATSADSIPVSVPAYVISAAPAPALASIELSSTTPGASAQYSVGELRAAGALAAGSATIQLKGPLGTVFPGALGDYSLIDLTHGLYSSHPTSISGAGTNDVVLTLGANIPAGDFLEVLAYSVVNPPPGDYSLSLTGDIQAGVPPTPPAPVPPAVPAPARTTTTLSVSPNPVLVGETATFKATVNPHPAGGTVSFRVDGAALAACNLRPVVNGQASCSTSFSTAGLRNIAVSYSGMSGFASSRSTIVGEQVNASASMSLSSSVKPAVIGQAVMYTATIVPRVSAGTVKFTKNNGSVVNGCAARAVVNGRASCPIYFWYGGNHPVAARYSGMGRVVPQLSARATEPVAYPAKGYWLLTSGGSVYGRGAAPTLGSIATSAATGPAVGIASTPTGKGYWAVTAHGAVSAFGDAKFYGDLPASGVRTLDIVAIAPTQDGHGYWLVGRDGGLFAFGDAKFHGSVPGLGLHVRDVAGMVASPTGAGYLLVGSDGGVFTFGSARFYGSLPGMGKHVHDIRAILPSSTGSGYVLVGSDGGAFVFGTGVRFLGSLPGRDINVADIVGIALTPDNGGYFMAGANGAVFGFGDATAAPAPSGLNDHLPVVAIAGT